MVEHRKYSQYFINIPVLLPPKSHGHRSLEGVQGVTESDTTEQPNINTHIHTHTDNISTVKHSIVPYCTPLTYIILYINYTSIKKG